MKIKVYEDIDLRPDDVIIALKDFQSFLNTSTIIRAGDRLKVLSIESLENILIAFNVRDKNGLDWCFSSTYLVKSSSIYLFETMKVHRIRKIKTILDD